MFFGDKVITVVNSYVVNKTTGEEIYICHTFAGCSWFDREQRAVDTAGLHKATIHQIRIPEESASGVHFYSPELWAGLSAAEKAISWTLGKNAKVIAGNISTLTAEEYAELAKHYTVAAQLSWHDNRGKPMPHWYVEGS